jgi:hypothetical protein
VSTLDIDAIEARANAATPGPWEVVRFDNHSCSAVYGIGQYAGGLAPPVVVSWCEGDNPQGHKAEYGGSSDEDDAFISASRTDIPALCAEVRRLRVQLENARARESAERAERIAAEQARDYAEAACAGVSWECGKCKEAG